MGYVEGAVGHFFPEVVVLLLMGIGSGGVADDAEGDEGDGVDVAGLGNGG